MELRVPSLRGGAGGRNVRLYSDGEPALGANRTVLVRIDNMNPILSRDSVERARVQAAGVLVGEDGMEFEL